MLVLQLSALLVAWASATFGIWSGDDVNPCVARLSTIGTTVGLIIGISIAVGEHLRKSEASKIAAQKEVQLNRQIDNLSSMLRLAVTGTELQELEVTWSFNNVSSNIDDVFVLSKAIEHEKFLSETEFSRLADDDIRRLQEGWHIENVTYPIISMIGRGTSSIQQSFEGDLNEALAAFGREWSDDEDPEDFWYDIRSNSDYYDLVFPIGSLAISLGKMSDDRVKEFDSNDPFFQYVFELTNYGFIADCIKSDKDLVFNWKYDKSSLRRILGQQNKPMAVLPQEFHFHLVANSNDTYKELSQEGALDNEVDNEGEEWMTKSELTITPNNVPSSAVTYDVTRIGVFDRIVETSKYDNPETIFQYVKFEAVMK